MPETALSWQVSANQTRLCPLDKRALEGNVAQHEEHSQRLSTTWTTSQQAEGVAVQSGDPGTTCRENRQRRDETGALTTIKVRTGM